MQCQLLTACGRSRYGLVPGMTVGFCLRGGSDEGFVPINEDNGTALSIQARLMMIA